MSHIGSVVLAAGHGSFREVDGHAFPKLLEPFGNGTVFSTITRSVARAIPVTPVVVVSTRFERLIAEHPSTPAGVRFVEQPARAGAGDALLRAVPNLMSRDIRHALVAYGDMPLWRTETMTELVRGHLSTDATISMVTFELSGNHPTALERYGRIQRDEKGGIAGVIEPKNATAEELSSWVNPSLWMFDLAWFSDRVRQVRPEGRPDGHGDERHVPPLVSVAYRENRRIFELRLSDGRHEEGLGVNTLEELEEVRTIFARTPTRVA